MKKNKIIFFFIFLIFCYEVKSNTQFHKIIVTINNYPITILDLENEIYILKLFNKNKLITNNYRETALNKLIEERIKYAEILNENLNIEPEELDGNYNRLINNLNLDKILINKNIEKLLKKKIKIEILWNNLIIKKYNWKININMNEIDKKIEQNKNIKETKDQLINLEKNKKLNVFSNFHFKEVKKNYLINYIK